MNARIMKILRDIKTLRIQGAREVAKAGIRALDVQARTSKAKNRKQFLSELQSLSKMLFETRPTEPALRNSVSGVILRISDHKDLEEMKKFSGTICRQYLKELALALEKIAQIGSGQIHDGDRIVTHCHSHSVVDILKHAKNQGKQFEVIATETRPLYQGLKTAKELSRAGIKVTFCVDSAIGYVMKKADRVLVGCDAILADGSIVNKIGTFPLALVAHRFSVPFLVAGGTYKFDPQTVMGYPEPIEQRDPGEVADPRKLSGVRIINPAFDITPAEYIHALITEKGVMRPEEARRHAEF